MSRPFRREPSWQMQGRGITLMDMDRYCDPIG
jgi:hypothetical protein